MNLNLTSSVKSKLPYIIVFLFALIAFFWFQQYREARRQLREPQSAQSAQIKAITAKVGKLIDLPQDEEPTIAIVTDLDKLANQPFFASAAVGDRVLIYIKNKKAILYRPAENKIINVSIIDTEGKTGGVATQNSSKEEAEALQIAVYYVKKDDEKLKTLQEKLKKIVPKASIVTQEKASNSDYKNPLVVDLNESKKEVAENIAATINARVGLLPLGEIKPPADILIILP